MRTIDIILAKRFGKGKKGMVIGWPWMMGIAGGGGAETTVTGVSPLLLAAALKKPIKSLVQYGLCLQDGTPTPDAPVDIMCNNGAVQMVDDELPIGYKRLTGIRFDGDVWYETGEALTGADDVTMTLDNTASQGQNVFGSYNGTSSGSKNFSLFIYGNGSSSGSYFRYGDQLLRPRFGTGERTITFGKNGTDGFATDATATPDTFETPANAYIGMLPNSTSPAYTGDIVRSILVGNRLEWIPCESDGGVIGYYEKYKGNFIAPTGSGTPVSLGYDTSHLVLDIVGTPEVLTVIQNQNTDPTIVTVTLASASSTVQWNSSSSCIVAPVKPNTVYTIGFLTKPTGGSIFRVATTKTKVTSSGTSAASIAYDLDKNNYEPKTLNSGEDAAWMYVQLSNTMTDEDFASILIQEGTSLTSPQTASAPDLFSVGDYADEVEIISGGVKRKVGVKVLTGEETSGWSRYSTNLYRFVPSDAAKMKATSVEPSKTHVLCTAYKEKTSGTPRMYTLNNSAAIVFADADVSEDTIAAFQAKVASMYAAGNPVIIVYPLATETTESVTPQPLNTTAGDNTISVEANVSPIQLEATFMKGE